MPFSESVWTRNRLINAISRFVLPREKEQDVARREFILNVLLVAIIVIIFVALAMHIILLEVWHIADLQEYENNALSLGTLFLLFFFFAALFVLSCKGFSRFASHLLLWALFLFASYMGYRWGVDLPAEILFYVLAITMSGILISTRFAFLMAFAISVSIWAINYLHSSGAAAADRYWTKEMWNGIDIAVAAIIFFTIATVSWLSNREIEKSLVRARRSETELKKERDSLETKVEERTRELREIQAEKMMQLYRLAEFGRLSSGIFHDLINPLNAIVLNMEAVKKQGADGSIIDETRTCMDSAISAAKKMEDMVIAVRKQISEQKNETIFSPAEEIRQVIDMMAHKARQAGVEVIFLQPDLDGIQIFGDAIRFNQAVLNLINNAIDAYPFAISSEAASGLRKVIVSLNEDNDMIFFSVRDYGIGVSKENFNRIFEPFFTTKGSSGMGIGLSIVKRIVEKNFDGKITMKSEQGQGTVFAISFQKKLHEEQ